MFFKINLQTSAAFPVVHELPALLESRVPAAAPPAAVSLAPITRHTKCIRGKCLWEVCPPISTKVGSQGYKEQSHYLFIIGFCNYFSFALYGMNKDEIREHFVRYGPLTVDWPHKAQSKAYFPPKGIYSSSGSLFFTGSVKCAVFGYL